MLSATSDGPKSTSCKKCCATLTRASLGQGWNQSMAVQLMSAGNFLALILNNSPIGEKQSTTCRLCRTRPMKYSIMLSDVSATPSAFAAFRSAPKIASYSSREKRSGMIPDASTSLMNTRNFSSTIWESVSRKVMGSAGLTPALRYSSLSSSLSSLTPNVLVTATCVTAFPQMKLANLARDCLPLPPTPTSSAFPCGKPMILAMRTTWSMATSNNTRFMMAFASLYSFS
mmetsp:Transcript_7547/g.21075  ORF Transcript_7547/g.21075 Transcript_7547/m.21075 type:complete len:229 (-) Transcript_7547:393-1079(-)